METLDSKEMINLVMLGMIVLVAGMVLWRISAIITKRKRKPKGSTYFSTKMKDKYDRM